MASPQDNIRRLYENGLKHFSLPDFHTFQQDMKDEEKRKRFYNNMQTAYSLPDFNTFSTDIGAVDVAPAQTPSPASASTATTVQPISDNTAQQSAVQTSVKTTQPRGWQPSPMQQREFQMQMAGADARLKKQGEEFQQRMEGIKKGNKPGASMGEREFNPQTGQIETAYYTTQGGRVNTRLEQSHVNKEYDVWWGNNTISGQLRRAYKERDELDKKASERLAEIDRRSGLDEPNLLSGILSNGDPMMGAMGATSSSQTQARLEDPEYQQYRQAIREVNERISTLENRKYVEDGGDHGFWRSLAQVVSNPETWVGSSTGFLTANAKLSADVSPGTESAQSMLESENEGDLVENEYGDFGFWSRAGVMTGEMLPFMLDFAMMGGTRSSGTAATRAFTAWMLKGGRNVAPRLINKALPKWTVKTLGAMPEELVISAAMANTVQSGKTAEDMVGRKLGHVIVDENGNYDYSNDKTWGSAVWQSEANAVIENYSEMFGAHIGGLAPALGKTFGGKRISGVLARAGASSYGKMLGTTRRQFERIGVSDYLGEVAEEYYGQMWRTMLNLDDAYTHVPVIGKDGKPVVGTDGNPLYEKKNLLKTGQFHGDIWGGMALSMGLMGGAKYSRPAIAYGVMRHRVNKADKVGASIFGPDRWAIIKEGIDNTTNDGMGPYAESLLSDSEMTAPQIAAAMSYMESTLNFRGTNLGSLIRQRGNEGDAESKRIDLELDESYLDGLNMSRDEDMNGVQLMYNLQRSRLEAGLSGLDIDISEVDTDPAGMMKRFAGTETGGLIRDYANAKMVYDGMSQAISDDIDERVAQSDAMIDGRTNRTTGMIHPATMKFEDRPVYVVDGNLVMGDDGYVDNEKSDSTIIIRDGETNALEFTDPKSILTADSPLDPNEEKLVRAESIRYAYEHEAEARKRGLLPLDNGDVIEVRNGGDFTIITIQSQAVDEETNIIPDRYVVRMPDGSLTELTRLEIQSMADDARIARLQELEANNAEAPAEQQTHGEPQSKYTSGQITIRNSDGSESRGILTGYLDEEGRHEYYVEGDLKHLHYATEHELYNILADYKPDEPQQPEVSAETVTEEKPIVNPQEYEDSFNLWLKNAQSFDDAKLNAEIELLRKLDSDVERGGLTDSGRGGLDAFVQERQRRVNEATMQTVPTTPESVPNNSEIPQNPIEFVPESAESVPNPAEGVENVQQPAAELTPLQRIPRDEKGEPVFDQADSPETAWDALVEFSEYDKATAKAIADQMVDGKRKALEKAQKQKPKGKTPTEILASKKAITADIATSETEYNLWQKIAGIEQSREMAVRSQQEAEARRLATERAEQEKAEKAAKAEAERIEREALEGIPEWHMDTPENARARGSRRFSGQLYTRQNPIQGIKGKVVEVKFSQNDISKGRVAVIEAARLQPSHVQGQRNPMFFIDEAQPKNRAEAVSVYAAKEIAEKIRPEEITGSATAYTGAPTVNPRGEVIQGNNRSDALRHLWENNLPAQQTAYKQYLLDNAEALGIDPEAVNAMQRPVLVNMLDVNDAESIRLGQMTAQDTESGGIERIKPKNVAQKLGDNMRVFANRLLSGTEDATFGQLVDTNGAEVLKWMNQTGVISNTQYQSTFDSKGNLTSEAKNDLQKVLYQAVFKGGSQQLEELFDKLPSKAQRAILGTAFRDMDSPLAGQMLPEIQASIAAYSQLMNDPTFANAKKLEEVLMAVEAFKQSFALDDRFEQYMPADNFSNFALHLAGLYKASDISQTTLASYFNQMYDLAQGTKAATLFEEADTTEYPLADVIRQVLGIEYKPAKNGNNDVANGSSDVALRNQVGQGGELRGHEPPADREQTPAGTEPSNRGARTDGDSRGIRYSAGSGEIQADAPQAESSREKPLTREEAMQVIADMEENAKVAPGLELTIENWDAEFGEEGIVNTPIGEVKMGENQFTKLMRQGRNGKLGMIKPTLEIPDVIIEDSSEAKEGDTAERGSSYVFVKTFVKPDGSRYYYFTSVTVSKDGHEVVVSNQEKRRNVLTNLLMKGKMVWKHADNVSDTSDVVEGLYSPQGEMSDPASEGTVAPQTIVNSEDKITTSSEEKQAEPQKSSLNNQVAAAEAEVDTNPTDAQKEAGNYKKGHVQIGTFDVTIENPSGSIRRGVDADGNTWENTMHNTYGYIRGTIGVDGDHIDVFLSTDIDGWNGRRVFVIDQYNIDGSFDEHKVMLGFNDKEDALSDYAANYDADWVKERRIEVHSVTIEEFEKWIESSTRKTKPFGEYSIVKQSTENISNSPENGGIKPVDNADGYTVTSKPYTNRQGKTLDTYHVTFDRDFSKEEMSTLRAKAKALKGWYDRETRGWMLRSADDAKAFAEEIVSKSEDDVADEAPLSMGDMKSEEPTVKKVDVGGVFDALKTKGETKLSKHAESAPEQPKPKKRRWVSDEDAAEFDNLRNDLRSHLGTDSDMAEEPTAGYGQPQSKQMDSEVLRLGTRMTYLMMKGGLRKFSDYAEAMVDEVGDAIRPHLKSLYAAAQNMEEVMQLGWDDEMDDRKTVKAFDVYNFDNPGAKDIIATAQHVVDENQSQQQTEEIIQSLKDQRNEQRKKEADETSADTEVIVNKAEAVASQVESQLETATTERDAETLSQSLDKEIEAVNEQLALLGYYEHEEDDSKFHESYGYMLTTEKKAVADATKLAKQIAKDLGIDIKVTSASTPLGRKGIKKGTTVRGNLAPAGGEIYITLPLNEGRELAIWIDLEPVSEQGSRRRGDNLEVERIMYRVEWPDAKGHTSFDRLGRNCWAEPNATYDELLTDIRREVRHFLPDEEVRPSTALTPQPGEDYVAMAERVIKDNAPKEPSIQPEQTMGDLFGGLFDNPEAEVGPAKKQEVEERKKIIHGTEFNDDGTATPADYEESVKHGETISLSGLMHPIEREKKETISKPNTNERTDVQPRSEETERGRHQPRPDEQMGTGAEHEDERTDGRGMAQRGGEHSVSDTERGTSVSRPSEGAERIRDKAPKNSRNNHVERGTEYAPKSEKARIDANIAAIELAKRLLEKGASAIPKEMAILRRYSGWGGLGSAFNEGNTYSPNPINKRLRELLTPEEYDAAVMSRNSAYYTPAPVIDAMWDIAKALGFNGGNIVEGSAGIGNIIGLMPTDISERSRVHAVEVEPLTGGILSLLYPDAKVEIQGFEQTRIPNGSVDLAITNVPFVPGLRVADESGDSDLSKKFRDIHDFCIAKNVRKLREGGIGIFITTRTTLDDSQKLRNWLVGDKEGCADVVGVFRMHNQTFGGTPATSDIIVVRKRVNGRKSDNAIDVSTRTLARTAPYEDENGKTKDLSMLINRYFIEHPECMGGEMFFNFEQGDTFRPKSIGLFPVRGAEQSERMTAWVKHLSELDWSKDQGTAVMNTTENVNEVLGENVKEGSMVLDSEGNLCIARIGRAIPLEINTNKIKGRTKTQCFHDYSELKDALAEVLKYQTEHEDDTGLQTVLDRLNRAYDTFVERYGNLNRNKNLAWLRNNDIDYPSIAALETVIERGSKEGTKEITYGKTDIFSRRVVDKEAEPAPRNVKDGIIASLYKFGRIDTEYLAGQLGKSQESIKEEIVKSGLGFENPTNCQMEVSYEYLSGNVREKLRQATAANEANPGTYDANIKALEAVLPMNIPAHLIEFSLGSSWITPKLYERFVKERTDLNVHLTNAGGTWHMDEPYYTGAPKNQEMGIRSEKLGILIPGHKIIEAAITNKTITVSKSYRNSDGSTETETDPLATAACAAKVDEIRQDFKDWAREQMQADPDMSMRMEEIYNERFNNSVPKTIPDEFIPEHFIGAATTVGDKPFRLRPHQAKAVIRATTQPVMLAHEVGTGKTYTLITTAMEMRRLGTARKPMIVVQNATVGQFVASAKALYPNAKVLTLEDADRNAEGRKSFYAKIKFNDWDMIVVPQSVFERIPDSIERQAQFIQDKIDEKMLVLEQMKEADPNGKSQIVRAAEREIEKLNDEIAQLGNGGESSYSDKGKRSKKKDQKKSAVTRQNAAAKAHEMLDRETDDVEDFDSMGIDAILVDEAHEYKHLGFATAMQRGVKGIDPSFSKKSQGVFLKAQSVLEKTGGKNVVFATGTPISNTAAEIWTFMRYLMPADVMKDYGIYYFDDFVRNFGNLQQMFEFATNGKYKENNRFAGYVNLPELVRIWSTVADTVLTREAGGVSDKIPQMEGDKAQDIFLPQTRALRGIMKYVKARLDEYDKMSGKEKKENSHIPLVMYGIAKAAAIDARLVQADAEDDPHSKTNEAVRQTLRTLEETKEYHGTIAIFADNYQNKGSGFNLYEDIRKKLIANGVTEEQIVVMKSNMTVKKKLEIFDKVNTGEVRVIMGSTFTLGTGVNIQERLHTLIHLDAPNRPMDYTQRNGRILRQGNLHRDWNLPVRILRFGVEDSLDVTAYQRLKTKGAIADSIMKGKQLMGNSMDNRSLEEEQELFGDITAQLSGSEYALLKNQIEKEVRKLTAKLKAWEADQTYIHNRKRQIVGQNKEAEKRIAANTTYLEKIEAATIGDITIGRLSFPGIEAMDDFFAEQNKKKREMQEQVRKQGYTSRPATMDTTISVGGFNFQIHTEISKEMKQGQGTLFASAPARMTYSCPELGIESMPVKENLIKNAVAEIMQDIVSSGKDFREHIESAQRSIERNNAELKSMEARDGVPFQFSDELAKAQERLDEYDALMKKEMEEKEAKYADLDKDVEAASEVTYTKEEDGEEEAEEPEMSYNSTESFNFANIYETQEGKTIRYTSESGEAYGVSESQGGNYDSRAGAELLQRQGDSGLYSHDSGLDTENGEFSVVERVFRENGAFNFTSGEKIESADDVAFIFSALEDAAKEHSFVVLVKDGKPTVVELGMGTFNQTMVDNPTAVLAYNRIHPDEVYFVHNHPSGNLMCSAPDVQCLRTFEKMFDVPVYGIIINLKTGKYGTFDTSSHSEVGEKRIPENEIHLKVHTLDKQIFAADYDPMAQPLVRGPHDVAQFLNSHRMGDRAKVSFLILSRAGRIVGNIHTPFTEISEDVDGKARYISERVIQFGGESAILYGDFDMSHANGASFRALKEKMKEVGATNLSDIVSVEGNHTRSAYDEGMISESGSEYGTSPVVKSAQRLAKKFNTPLRVVTDTEELPTSLRSKKGFYDTATGEVVIIGPNHDDAEDVAETVFHEVVAHKGLREMIGDENYDSFCDEVYNHLRDDLKSVIDEETTRRFMSDPGKGYERHRRVAVDELFGRLSEKGFEDFTKAERSIWAKLKEKVLEAINKFLGSVKLPKWVKLGDNELRYMLWRSHERLRTKGDYVDIARDAAKRDELGLNRNEVFREESEDIQIERAAEKFNKQLERYSRGEMAKSETLRVGMPQGVMRHFLPNLPIVMRQRILTKASVKKHNVDVMGLRDMPRHLSNPIFVFKRTDDVLGVLTEMRDRDGKNVCVAIELNRRIQDGGEVLEVNDIRSAHGRNVADIIYPIVQNGTLRWVDKEKGLDYLSSASRYVQQEIDNQDLNQEKGGLSSAKSNSQAITAQILDDAAKVIESFENPTIAEAESFRYRFRTVSSGAARQEYDERVRTMRKRNPGDKRAEKKTNRAAQLHEAYLDGMRSLRVLQEAVSHETGSEIESHEDAYEFQNQMSSRNKNGEEEYESEYMKPMFDAIAEICKGKEQKRKYGELVDYVLAKHGLERNAFMRSRAIANGVDSDKADATDYAGLTSLTGEQDVAEAEIAAARMVDDYEAAVDTTSLWNAVNAATKAMLITRYTSGLLSRDMYDTIRTQYQNYIPLKGWEETVAADVYEYAGGGYGLGSALMKAYGRSSVADDPFATIVTDAQRTIMEANRNIMKQRFLDLALNHPTDLLTVNKQWYVRQADGSWLPNNPVIPADADADLVDAIVKQHESNMLTLESNGDATKRRAGLQLGLNTIQGEPTQHMVKVKRNGEEFCIYVNGDPRAARAINGMLNPDAGEKTKIAQVAQEVKNFMSKAFTTWNPEFIVGNLSRDLMFAGTAVAIKEDAPYARKYAWNITNILAKASLPRLLYKWRKGTLDDSVDIERYFKEFLHNGGETGFTQLNTVDKVKKDMQRFIREAQGGVEHLPKKVWRSFWNGIEFINRAAEDTTRFGVYMTSRQSGRTISRSISDAKEITVNFNRKGSGAWGARHLNFLYVFFNACMQAMSNAGRLIKKHPIKSSVAMASFMAAGFLVPMVSAIFTSLFGDEEDDYWNLPEWVRRNNICIYIPFTKKWLTLPISHELRPFYGVGEIAYSTMNGKETSEDAVMKGVESFSGIMPIDWTGNGGDNVVNFAPTIAQPLVQISRNTDYFGKLIYKKTPWNENEPEWSKAYKGTNGLLVDATRMLSEANADTDEFGVTTYPQHWYSGDINPAIVEHLLESYSGGLGKTINGMAKTISMLWNEDAREMRNVPVARKFLQSSDEKAEERRFSNEYFKLRTEYEELQQYYGKLCKNVKGNHENISSWIETEQGQRYMMLRNYMSQINKIENDIKQSQEEAISAQWRERADSMKKELVLKTAMQPNR